MTEEAEPVYPTILNPPSGKKVITIDRTRRVCLEDSGIFYQVFRRVPGTTEMAWSSPVLVCSNRLRPLKKLIIDDYPYYTYTDNTGKELTNNMTGIVNKLRTDGDIVKKTLAEDVISASFLGLETEKGHATLGVYMDDGKLQLCTKPHPIKDSQIIFNRQCISNIDYKMEYVDIDMYLSLIDHWHPYEILPTMGLSMISPLSYVLRRFPETAFIPHIYNYSPLNGLGKSVIQRVFSLYLYGIDLVPGNTVNSEFRINSLYDSIGSLIVIDEAGSIDWTNYLETFKFNSENPKGTMRGNPKQGMADFWNRGVLAFNGNRFPITDQNALVRFFKVEFDEKAVGQRRNNPENVRKLKNIISVLSPIGWQIIKVYLECINNDFAEMRRRIFAHETNFRDLYAFSDPRRAIAWANVYEGLKIWETVRATFDEVPIWSPPTYEEFVEGVITRVEKETFETKERPIEDFLHWWEMWKASNIRNVTVENNTLVGQIIGKGIFWDEKTIKYDDKEIKGDVITKPILRLYKKDKHREIDTLPHMAKEVVIVTDLPMDKINKVWNIGSKSYFGVFIPNNMWKYKELK